MRSADFSSYLFQMLRSLLNIMPDVAFAPTLVEIQRSSYAIRGFQQQTYPHVTLPQASRSRMVDLSILPLAPNATRPVPRALVKRRMTHLQPQSPSQNRRVSPSRHFRLKTKSNDERMPTCFSSPAGSASMSHRRGGGAQRRERSPSVVGRPPCSSMPCASTRR